MFKRWLARGALKRVNQIRAKHNSPALDVLPVGYQSNVRSCVLAESLPNGIAVLQGLYANDKWHRHTFRSLLFIFLFDRGRYPAYVKHWMGADGQEGEAKRREYTESPRARRQRRAEASLGEKLRAAEARASEAITAKEVAIQQRDQAHEDLRVERLLSDRLRAQIRQLRAEKIQREKELEHERVFDDTTEEVLIGSKLESM